MQRTVAIIEARMASSRLPGKVLAPVLGRPMLELLIERISRARLLDGIVVATTTNPQDDAVEQLCARLAVGCYRGSEDDVLARVLEAADAFEAGVIVELTADNPLLDPGVIDLVIGRYRHGDCDFAANMLERGFPVGLDTLVFSTELLRRVASITNDPADREHVSLYIYNHPEQFRLCNVAATGLPEGAARVRLTVDVPEDLDLIRRIYGALYPKRPEFSTSEVLAYVAEEDSVRRE